jgi:hypothetical protein
MGAKKKTRFSRSPRGEAAMTFWIFVALILVAWWLPKARREPTLKMRRYAEDVAKLRGIHLDPKTLNSFGATRRFLNANGHYRVQKGWRR